MVALTGILFCFSGAVVLAHCIPLDRDVIKDRREPLSPVVVNSAFPVQSAIEELMSKQFGGGLLGGGLGGGGGGGNFGSVLAGSVIGSGLATILPLLLRPALLGATALIPRLVQNLNAPGNFDAHIVNLPGSKDHYLYLTLTPQSTPDAPKESNHIRQDALGSLPIPYVGTKLGTVNIKSPLSNLNVADLSSRVKQIYEENDYKR